MQNISNLFKRIYSNPALGLIPYFVFSILIGQVNTVFALLIGFLISVLPLVLRMKAEIRILYDVSAWSFLITSLGVVFLVPDLDPQLTFILAEIVLVFSLMIFRLSRKGMINRVRKAHQGERKYYLYESFQVAFQAQYTFTFHLIVILGFRVFFILRYPMFDIIMVLSLFQILTALIIIMQALRLKILDKRLKKEEWLPVVSESGVVQGKIAKSVSLNLKNKFLHPLVRVALIYDGMLYLRTRNESRFLDPSKLDYPFEKYMQYKHNIQDSIQDAIKEEIKIDHLPVRFILKYVFENENTKRLIFLYVSNIESEKDFNDLHLKGGKLWTTNQIDDNIGNNIFSECLELEFEYLKNTVLMANLPKRQT
ncbi:MAG: hypothetical protein ACOH2V_13115 [Candidatus Saccharimonadaceae bacterium]